MNLFTVLKTGGEYNESHVLWLRRQVYQNIFCITDSAQPMQGVIRIPMLNAWPGWWCKMELFRPDITGDWLYCDLDTVFIDGIPNWKLDETTVLYDMYGCEHINSGLMYTTKADRTEVWREWVKDPEGHMAAHPGGDQFFLDRFWRGKARFQSRFPGEVVSYKADVLERGLNDAATVVCFHGQPRPWGVKESWVPTI